MRRNYFLFYVDVMQWFERHGRRGHMCRMQGHSAVVYCGPLSYS